MYRISLLSIALFVVMGCGAPRSSRPKPSVTSTTVTWPELEAFVQSNDDLIMPAVDKRWKEVVTYAKTDAFKAAVEKFAASEIPSTYANADREAAFETIVAKCKELIAAAEGKAKFKKIASIYSEFEIAMKELAKK